MRSELSLILVLVILADLVVIGLITQLRLGPFYKMDKIRKMKSAYHKLAAMADETTDMTDEIMEMSVQDNIIILLANSDLTDSQSTKHDASRNRTRLFGYISGFYNDKITVLKQTEEYTLQESRDTKINTNYLEMWGQLSNDYWFLLQTPLESMTGAVRVTMIFYIIVGTITVIISALGVSLLMRRYTRPIAELSELSKRMASLDFSAKYSGRETNEIGELGESFNIMSKELEENIASLKAANIELQKDNERKTHIDEVRKDFLNNVSHELKTPLALIQGYAEGLKDNIAEDPESRDFYLDVIIDEASKMNTMVRKLLTLNQLEFGNDPVVMEHFDLQDLIKGVIAGMQIMIEESGASVHFPETRPVMVWGDSFKIEEVVTNYLSNAVNHASGEKKILISFVQEGNAVRTEVFNTGDPIPEDDREHIFEKFYKVDKARTRSYGGSGIGLSIVKAVMDGHNQQCGVRNCENGVSFWFTLEGRIETF